MARPKRDSRFDILYKFYQGFKAEVQTIEVIKDNVGLLEYFLYASEMEKFAEKYPEVDMEDFKVFLAEVGAYREAGKKTGGGGRQTRLNTTEKAEAVGVAPENFERYVQLVNAVFEVTKELNVMCTTGRVSFAIPKLKVEVAGDGTDATPENTQAEVSA